MKWRILVNNHNFSSFIAQSKDDLFLNKSSSGGMFPELAKFILNNNGIVFGASFTSNTIGFEVKHIFIDSINDLFKISGSKYVQSSLGSSLKNVKYFLENNKTVLFSGTPCQILALKNYLKKDYDNLITVDVSCSGVPSKKIFNDYIKFLEKKYRKKIVNFEFRNKEKLGWSCGNALITFQNGSQKIIYNRMSSYLNLFMNRKIQNKSCINCNFTGIKRLSDITLADAWGVENEYKELLKDGFNKNKGISLVLLNTEKGKEIFNLIDNKINFSEINIYKMKKYNAPLNKKVSIGYSNIYLDEYKKNGYAALDNLFNKNISILKKIYYSMLPFIPNSLKNVYKYFRDKNKCDCALITWALNANYGSVLTGYALKKAINNLGYSAKTVKYYEQDANYVRKFNKKYQDFLPKTVTVNDLKHLTKYTNTFIVGSDNQLNFNVSKYNVYRNLLFYLPKYTKKAIISGSFGFDKFDINDKDFNILKILFNRFDYISTREDSGVNIINQFDCCADCTLDPVFLLDKEEYLEIAESSKLNSKNKIMSYILYPSDEINNIVDKIKKDFGAETISFIGNKVFDKRYKNQFIDVADWLSAIINSKLIITDSYHCVCFALMFHKPFICLKNNNGFVRFESLFKIFNLSNITSQTNDIKVIKDFDYAQIDKIINENKSFVNSVFRKIFDTDKELTIKQLEAEKELKTLDIKKITKSYWYRENKFFYYFLFLPIIKPILKNKK